ncbi:MAG: SbmA/BacA-like family transporter [Francisella endosymbiont of Hyalomma asiaticum]
MKKENMFYQGRIYNKVVDNFYKVTFYKAKIDIVRSFFVQIYCLTGTILALPRYLAKSISFGQIIQVQSVFYNVISPMLFLVFWYENLAELRTNVSRLSELKKSMQTSQQQNNTRIINCQQQALITLENITKQDDVLLKNITFSLVKVEGLFIHGRIGIGKTNLLRVINGHSDNFIGKIVLNKIPKIFFYHSAHISLRMIFKE